MKYNEEQLETMNEDLVSKLTEIFTPFLKLDGGIQMVLSVMTQMTALIMLEGTQASDKVIVCIFEDALSNALKNIRKRMKNDKSD